MRRSHLVEARQRLEVIVLTEVERQGEQTEDLSVETELQEEPVVVFAHAVIDPGSNHSSLSTNTPLPVSGLILQRSRFGAKSSQKHTDSSVVGLVNRLMAGQDGRRLFRGGV